MYANFSDLL